MSRTACVTIICVLAACGSSPSAPEPDATVDAVIVADAGPRPDGQPFEGVACNGDPNGACEAPASVCCLADSGDTCTLPQTLCTGPRMQCDGAEDCNPGEVCCYISGHGALCTEADMCGGGDQLMCHPGGTACANGLHCCPLPGVGARSGYGVCRSIACG